ncbi:M1 family metallopeptidase [Psychrobacillus sp.]|uniref:M1 family metallopeptidase n=1 Tax=Psychrobacillus sp. TaxID=1871623 RepID=UPI0028BF0EB6|nr:M1 family metallopeptidase [Psychrobacillus sp.]
MKTNNRFKMVAIFVGLALLTGVLCLFAYTTQGEEKKTSGEVKLETSENILPGARGAYVIDIKLNNDKKFHISAEVEVTNDSKESWKDIGFDFIPNALTKENKPYLLPNSGKVSIISITKSSKEIPYELTKNKLFLKLEKSLKPGKSTKVKIEYTLELPENGFRLSRVDDSYYLAHWYPMLGHYQNGWNINDYLIKGESYDTSYGSYVVNYDLPKEFLVASSGYEGDIKQTSAGKIEGNNIKDFYMALLDPKDWISKTSTVNGTTLRLFFPSNKTNVAGLMIKDASDAFAYFEENIGDYPFSELDIIANNGGMEYPNIVEVSNNEQNYENTLVHEIAHQWFYFMVSNNPYNDAWLDESLTVFLTSTYLLNKYGDETTGFERALRISAYQSNKKIVNIAQEEFGKGYVSTIYGKVPILLRDFFKELGGQEEALKFLSAYFKQFQFKYVDSYSFSVFFNEYFQGDYSDFLEEWLELKKDAPIN